MSEENKSNVTQEPENKDKGTVYITVHERYCRQVEGKIDPRVFNVMHLPKGVKVGDLDLSGAIINPKVMMRDKYNKNMYCAAFNKKYLEDNSVLVAIRKGSKYEHEKVDIDLLANAVKTANRNYMESRKAVHEKEHTYDAKEHKEDIDV